MARERWFYAFDNERRGPVALGTLVDSLLTQPDPRACLVWRKGLSAWTRAGEVGEVGQRLAPFLAETVTAPPPASARPLAGEAAEVEKPRDAEVLEPEVAIAALPSRAILYAGAALVVVVLLAGGWALFFRGGGGESGAGLGTTTSSPGGGTGSPAPGASSPLAGAGGGGATGPRQSSFAGWSENEADLPAAEVAKLKGVAGWSGNTLTITLYNGSTWRVTELLVRTSRLEKDAFIDDPTLHRLAAAEERMEAGVEQLLDKVAPDRRKPGVNPLDTGPFKADIGPHPEAYRWTIEGGKGYPPKASP